MPELPEVETVRRTLGPLWLGRRISGVRIARRDYIRASPPGPLARALGRGGRVETLVRHGKQLAAFLDDGRAILIHLGMSGQVLALGPGARPARADHCHVRWSLVGGGSVVVRDPRRFGGVWAYPTAEALREARWVALGPDALSVRAAALARSLGTSRRAVKACLLDQRVLAGVGNIYADEALFRAGVHPLRLACSLSGAEVAAVARAVRLVLRRAIEAGGSTLRDFVDAANHPGTNQRRFRVYGRAGHGCVRCGSTLVGGLVAQRATVWCPACQTGPYGV
jgi:formamidopyrimidine-DNA glycosylase